jgi:uncharacterized protein (DUF2236 family)
MLRSRLEKLFREQLHGGTDGPPLDFTQPPGESALSPADSISWIVFANPVSLFIGGITAVLLELAEPKVRSGVWDHTTFRTDPLKRMRRTGLAAMVTVYGAHSTAERMIAGVRRMHDQVQGTTPDGIPYQANDPDLLRWVHATAAFGFLEAYHTYVKPVSLPNRDRFYAEGVPIARLYGAESAPASEAELHELFGTMHPRLQRSEIVFEFLEIIRRLPLLPPPLRPMNGLFVRAAIQLLPPPIRETLGLRSQTLPRGTKSLIRLFGKFAEQLHLDSSPASQARRRVNAASQP